MTTTAASTAVPEEQSEGERDVGAASSDQDVHASVGQGSKPAGAAGESGWIARAIATLAGALASASAVTASPASSADTGGSAGCGASDGGGGSDCARELKHSPEVVLRQLSLLHPQHPLAGPCATTTASERAQIRQVLRHHHYAIARLAQADGLGQVLRSEYSRARAQAALAASGDVIDI